MYDYAGRREEFHWGLGLSLLNHFDLDWYRIESEKTYVARDKQWGLSLSVRNPFVFEERDYRWYLTDEAGQQDIE
jgi:hypothetical protein